MHAWPWSAVVTPDCGLPERARGAAVAGRTARVRARARPGSSAAKRRPGCWLELVPRTGREAHQHGQCSRAARRSAIHASTTMASCRTSAWRIAAPEPIRARFRGREAGRDAQHRRAAEVRLVLGHRDHQHRGGTARASDRSSRPHLGRRRRQKPASPIRRSVVDRQPWHRASPARCVEHRSRGPGTDGLNHGDYVRLVTTQVRISTPRPGVLRERSPGWQAHAGRQRCAGSPRGTGLNRYGDRQPQPGTPDTVTAVTRIRRAPAGRTRDLASAGSHPHNGTSDQPRDRTLHQPRYRARDHAEDHHLENGLGNCP